MSLEGKVINGNIVLDDDVKLREGVRVRVELNEDDVPMPPPETREEILASLRQCIEDDKAGLGQSLDEVMSEIAAEFKLAWVKPE